MNSYLFTSDRLGFRTWTPEDLDHLIRMNADPDVMRYFPATLTPSQNKALLERMVNSYKRKGYCYFPVEEISSGQFIGFIGMVDQFYDSPFTPGVDIGWRILPQFWGKGLATEGAKRALEFGFEQIGLDRIFSIAPSLNKASIAVMKKIGMKYLSNFIHPYLSDSPDLASCTVYQLAKTDYLS